MTEQLTAEQILLINNLMYIPKEKPFKSIMATDAKTVKNYIDSILTQNIDETHDYGSFLTGEDWKNTINAIKQDDQLMNMEIAATHIDDGQTGGGGNSALFVNPKTGEAVVTFRSTANHEWQDNFIGGGMTDTADGVSTPHQENALAWYQSLELDQYSTITVTGHSKGGNKAKYITVTDDSVDRCVSFDGQGFSDEFMQKYENQIAHNQSKINNHNVDRDYVNLLLNDIGKTTFYHGYEYGVGGFLENHCPNTFFEFQSDGTIKMNEGSRDEGMASVDEFLNSYLRTLSPEDKRDTLAMIGKMVEKGFNGEDINDILGILLKDDHVDFAANLAAYLLVYKKENPEILHAINEILKDTGMEDMVAFVNVLAAVSDWKYFRPLLETVGKRAAYLPDGLYEWLDKKLKEAGITLSRKEMEKLLGMLNTMAKEMGTVDTSVEGSDIAIAANAFSINIKEVICAAEELGSKSGLLRSCAERIRKVAKELVPGCRSLQEPLFHLEREVLADAEACKKMGEVLKEICYCYRACEKKIAGSI